MSPRINYLPDLPPGISIGEYLNEIQYHNYSTSLKVAMNAPIESLISSVTFNEKGNYHQMLVVSSEFLIP